VPWVRASLRGQLVYARADGAGALKVENGRVEVRYKPNDGRRYEARADNLAVSDPSPLPDETCGPAEPVQKPGPRSGGTPSLEGAIVAYADGACSGNPGPAGLGVVILDGDRRIEISEYLGSGKTNNIAELTAILRALEAVSDLSRPLIIRTDSQYSIGVLQKGWKAKANVDLVRELRDALAKRPRTDLQYVPGHAGVKENERADALAREAVQTRSTRRAEHPPVTKSQS
jgi:ribonuclease HI